MDPNIEKEWRPPQRFDPCRAFIVAVSVEVARVISAQYGFITKDQARAAGLSDGAIQRRVAAGLWTRKYRGVFRDVAVPLTWQGELKAVTLRSPGGVWVSHAAAARFWQLDGFEGEPLEVTSMADLRSPSSSVRVHKTAAMPRIDIAVVRSIPVTTVHRTLIDLGVCVPADRVELALECALRRGTTTISRLTRRLQALEGHGRRGPSVLKEVLSRRGWDSHPTESALETRFLQFIRRHNLPRPHRQVRIYDDDGFVARVDFFYSTTRVVVEVESRRHHSSRADWERDLRRRNALTTEGYRVLHVTHERMTRDPDCLASELRKLLGPIPGRSRTTRPRRSS
jgi:very-short-patch-repair endonuclease